MSPTCDCSVDVDWEACPKVERVTIRQARKEYVCCECHDPIKPSERYELFVGCWESGWDQFRTCLTCAAIRKDRCPNGYEFGGLDQRLRDCLGIGLKGPPVEGWWDEEEDDHAV